MIEHLVNMLKSLGFNVKDLKKEKKNVPLLGMECWRTPWAQEHQSFEARDKRTCSMRAFLPTSVSQSYNPVCFYCQIVKKRWTHEAETPDFLGLLCTFWAAILIRMSRSRLGMELGGEVVTRPEWNTGLKPQDPHMTGSGDRMEVQGHPHCHNWLRQPRLHETESTRHAKMNF